MTSYEPLLVKNKWDEIDEKLGVVSGFEVKNTTKGVEIHYLSNDIPQIIYSTDDSMKDFIQSFLYCASAFSHKPVI